jgi:hypothetical protein
MAKTSATLDVIYNLSMFKDKFEFKRDFTQRVVELYGRSVEQSHITERYIVLGEMVRDYASIHWKENKNCFQQFVRNTLSSNLPFMEEYAEETNGYPRRRNGRLAGGLLPLWSRISG